MNYQYSGQYGSARRRMPPSTPDEKFVRDNILSHSDFSPSGNKGSAPTFADKQEKHAPTPQKNGVVGNSLAMVYSPVQAFADLYDEDIALSRGTLFSKLDLVFEGSKCSKERC